MAGRNARERLLQVAADLFYRHGFHAVGLERIVDEAGTTKTTLYRYFDSKDALILHVLEEQDRWWHRTFTGLLAEHGGDTPLGQLRAVFDVLESLFARDMFNGCMFVNASVEFPLPHDPIHEAAARHRHMMESIVRDLAVRAGATDPLAFAQGFALVMDAAFLARQISGEKASLDAARRLAAMLLEQHVPVSA